jgi:sugar lactone lactonase YvrE
LQGTELVPLQLNTPLDVWVDRTGRYYVADTGNSRVLQLTPEGEIKERVTELDAESVLEPLSVVANDTQVWVADPERGRLTIYQINTVSEGLP